MEIVNSSEIEKMIYLIRGQKVMLDTDLAKLYDVETKRLIQQINRNLERFPKDFMFQLTENEYQDLLNISKNKINWGGRRYLPYVFTECGVAMLSSILKSKNAISVNISIMRIFVKLRSFLSMETILENKVGKIEKSTNQLFKIVFERLDNLEENLPAIPKDRKKIGFKINSKKS